MDSSTVLTLNITVWNTSATTEAVAEESTPALACKHNLKYISLVLIGFICLFGFVGNILTIIVMRDDRKTSPTSLLLISLAFYDEVVLVISFIRRTLLTACSFNWFNSGYCSFQTTYLELVIRPLFHVAHMGTTYITVIVTLHRFIGVCLPTQAAKLASMRIAKIQIIGVTAFAVTFTFPRFLEQTLEYDENGEPYLGEPDYIDELYNLIYKETLYSIFIYVIPLSSLAYFTLKLFLALRKAAKKSEALTQKSRDRNDITLALVSVVVVFFVCQLFNPVRRYVFWRDPDKGKKCSYHLLSQLTFLAIAFNSAINFVIYCVVAARFRRKLWQFLTKRSRIGPSETSVAPQTVAATQSSRVVADH